MVAKKLKYVKGRSRSFESHSSLLHIMHHLVFKSTSRLILSASRFTSLYTCQAISSNCIGCECPSVPYPLPVGSSCLPMSAQHGAALPHRPAPTGEQRWLPVDQARCSSHRTRDHRWPCVQFNCSFVEQFANGSAVFRVTGHFSTPPEN